MGTVADLYNALISPHLAPKPPKVPYFSTVYGQQVHGGNTFGPQYWQLNMESPVLFRSAVSRMLGELGQDAAHLEIGPHSALAGPLRQIYKETGHTAPYASVVLRGEDSSRTFLDAVGKLFCFGIRPHIPVSDHAFTLPDLPTYPWNYEGSYWSETRVMASWRFRKYRRHELLGQRVLESSDLEPAWRNLIKLSEVAWLADHCVGNDIVFPAAAYIAMVGEAVSQLTEATGYTVREVHMASAMLLSDNKPTEVLTTIRKKALTSSLDSKWYEFSISSESNGTWTKHCWGLVAGGCALACPAPKVETYVKKVNSNRWYTAMARIGLNYGPRFVGLEDITSSPVHQVAALSITDQQDEGEPYALHPATLDLILQSWAVASTRGEYRELTELFLPTFIEDFYVGRGAGKELRVNSTATGLPGTALGHSYGVADDEVIFMLKGFKGTRMEDAHVQQAPELKALTLQWHPDIECARIEDLIRPTRDSTTDNETLERLYAMCAVEIHQKLAAASCAQPHFELYRSWLAKEVERYRQPGLPLVLDSADIVAMSTERRCKEIDACHRHSQNTFVYPVVEALWRTYANMMDILEGRVGLLDVLLEDGLLAQFYDWCNSLSDLQDFFKIMGCSKPQLHVLEIGAGTGGTTAHALDALNSEFGERLYQDYTITDVSAGFLAQCRERFKDHQNIQYAVLDITKDPLEQGFELGAYDLIVASNVRDAPLNTIEQGGTDAARSCTPLLAWLRR